MALPITGSGFAPASTVELELHSTPTSLGSALVGSDGTFSTAVTIPDSTEGGTHHVVGKGTGADGNVAAPQVALFVDASAPQLLSVTVTPDSVDTSESSRTITVTAHITDELTGNAGLGASSGASQIHFVSPSGQRVYAMLDGSKRVSGSPQDGWYEATITLPRFAEQGTWKAQWIVLYDQVGNTRQLTGEAIEAAGLATSFKNG